MPTVYNKVVIDGVTKIDLSQDTVTEAGHILTGHTGHLANGNQVSGTGGSGSLNLQARINIAPSTSSQTITADSGYDGLSSVQINAMPSGTEGTPTATKGTVNNHAVTVTPSVTNTTGYITGGTKTGTAVTVSASELVSGSETKTSNDTYDVTNLAELVVNVPTGTARSSSDLTVSGATVTVPAGLYSTQATKSVANGSAGTPTASKGTVSNHSITVTPSVTNTTGYITGSTKTGTGITVSASELVSGSETKTENGTYDVTNLASLVVNVASSGGGKNAQISNTVGRATSSTYTAVGPSITVTKTGTYDVYWFGYRSSTSGTNGSQLYIGSTAYGSAQTTFNTGSGLTNTQTVHLSNVSLTANQVLTIRARSRGNNYYMYILGLAIIEV